MPDPVVIVVGLAIAVAGVAIVAAAGSRLWFARGGASFRCRFAVLPASGSGSCGIHTRWSRLRTRARWRGEALVIRLGPLRVRTLRLPAHLPLDAHVHRESCALIGKLGEHPLSLLIRPVDGPPVLVAVRARDRTRLVGPFLVAALTGLPFAPPSAPPSQRWHPT